MRPRRLTGLAVGIAATALVPLVSLDRFIFFPDRNVPPPPGVLERWFTTADGVRLLAWHAVAPDGAPTLVWSHGNAGNIAGRAPVLHALATRGPASSRTTTEATAEALEIAQRVSPQASHCRWNYEEGRTGRKRRLRTSGLA